MLTIQQKTVLFQIYQDLLQRHASLNKATARAANEILTTLTFDDFSLKIDKIDIQIEFNMIVDIYEKTGILLLRIPKNEESILLGCGQNPLTLSEDYKDQHPDKHSHPGYYTINPDIFMNPCMVAFFGIDNERIKEVCSMFNKKFSIVTEEAVINLAVKKKDVHSWNYDFLTPDFTVQAFPVNSNIPEFRGTGPKGLEDFTVESEDEFYSQHPEFCSYQEPLDISAQQTIDSTKLVQYVQEYLMKLQKQLETHDIKSKDQDENSSTKYTEREQIEAFLAANHPRLGVYSPARALSNMLMWKVVECFKHENKSSQESKNKIMSCPFA